MISTWLKRLNVTIGSILEKGRNLPKCFGNSECFGHSVNYLWDSPYLSAHPLVTNQEMANTENPELVFYDGLCSESEKKFRLSQKLVSRWEKKELVAEFCRAGKKQIRIPSALSKSVCHLLQVRRYKSAFRH